VVQTDDLAKLLVIGGLTLVVAGLLVWGLARVGFVRLPGDFTVEVGGVRIHLLLGLSILLSVVGTIVLNLAIRRR
jgi:hypothetical protein